MKIRRFKRFHEYIKESFDFTESSIVKEIEELIETTIETSGGNYDDFINSYIKNPNDYNIDGLINDSDIYEFYLKYRNDIDQILSESNYFDDSPAEKSIHSLYDYIIDGVKEAVIIIIENINNTERNNENN